MSNFERVTAHLPYLRRFARATTGSQRSGDAYVVSALEAILADPTILPGDLSPRVALYRTFLKIVNSIKWNDQGNADPPQPRLDAVRRNLGALAPRARQAFLLIAVEEFSAQDAALVMDVDAAELQRLIDEAGREIARQLATNVVIIEDEPLIARSIWSAWSARSAIASSRSPAPSGRQSRQPGARVPASSLRTSSWPTAALGLMP
jgi:DNA-directed RNA polymerase specialized sigma24 family protein